MAIWSLRSVQASWFTAKFADLNPAKIFERLTGSEPESFQRNPVGAPRGVSFAFGVVEGRRYQITVTPGRLDLVCSDPSEGNPEIDYAGLPVDQTIKSFFEKVSSHPWVESANRLSTVVTLRNPAASEPAAADVLWELVAPVTPIAGATDVILQVNSVRQYDGVNVNRIVKYQTERLQGMMLQLDGTAAVATGDPSFFASVQFDFNTVPDGRDFNIERQIATFDRLIALQLHAVRDLHLGVVQK